MKSPKSISELLLAGDGAFNQIIWQTQPRFTSDQPIDKLCSLHEWSHHELNNVSSFGAILTFYAMLARHALKDRPRYDRLLSGLLDRCRTAHEIYATWYSVDHLAVAYPRNELLGLLPGEYQRYEKLGEHFVQGIESPFLRQQVFLTAVRTCFEAIDFAGFRPEDWDRFELSFIRGRDFPNGRLEFLRKTLPLDFLPAAAADFRLRHPDRQQAELIEIAIGKGQGEDFFRSDLAQADAATREFLKCLYQSLASWLAERDRPIGAFEGHLVLIPRLLAVLKETCDADSVTHPLVATSVPHDSASVILLQMESEVYRVRETPVPMTMVPISGLPEAVWKELPAGDPPHLLVQARLMESVCQQHGEPAGAELPVPRNSPLVFLRHRTSEQEGHLFYFGSPAELTRLTDLNAGIPAYGVVSSVLCGDETWLSEWPVGSVTWLILIEHSLHAFLTRNCASEDFVRYDVCTLHQGERSLKFLCFLTSRGEDNHSLYLAVCSEMLARSCVLFIENALPKEKFIREGTPFENDLGPMLSTIVTHLWKDETFFTTNLLRYS